MVDKLYAKWKKSENQFVIIDSDTALDLKNQATIITNPKDKAVLFDIETDLAVRPVKGRKAKGNRGLSYYSFYPGEDSPLKGISKQIEWSDELKIFLEAFQSIKKFQIEEFGSLPVIIIPEKMEQLKVIDTDKGRVILKFLVKIDQTYPYSWGYQYNGVLGLEFIFTGKPTPSKKIGLEEKGISLFEAHANFPKYVDIPDDLSIRKNVDRVVNEVRDTYQNRNYHLLGKFVNKKITFLDYQEKYQTLKHYEDEKEILKKELEKLHNEKLVLEDELRGIEEKKVVQRQNIDKENKLYLSYQQKNEYYQLLENKNNELLAANEKLKRSESKLSDENLVIKNQFNKYKNRSLWAKIWKKE